VIDPHVGRRREIALGALVRRLDGVRLDGPAVWSDRMVIRGPASVPIAFRPA
jgi:cytochrome P450